jgi:hypothetical protein|tara:strand:+ start:5991 stop:6935 length:945 start_codon:yes stop_codon:yes gene_type:complete
MEKKISLFLAILTLGFAQQIFAQDDNASADDTERWSDFLPLNKELAGDADLPLPFGIGITGYTQEQDMLTDSISITAINPIVAVIDTNVVDGFLALVAVPDLVAAAALAADPTSSTTIDLTADKVESDVEVRLVRLDAWILPFLNIYGVGGKVEGDNKVIGTTHATSAAVTAALTNFPPISYEGDVYGAGVILAYSKGRWWGTLDYSYTEADLDISASEITTHTISPRIGTTGNIGNLKGSIWIGGMHQDVDEHQLGTVPFPPATVDYDVKQHAEEEWNFLVGGSLNLTKHIEIGAEGGFGDREQVMGNLTFRF